eukprot:2943956-Rhodomonas_salina.2
MDAGERSGVWEKRRVRAKNGAGAGEEERDDASTLGCDAVPGTQRVPDAGGGRDPDPERDHVEDRDGVEEHGLRRQGHVSGSSTNKRHDASVSRDAPGQQQPTCRSGQRRA